MNTALATVHAIGEFTDATYIAERDAIRATHGDNSAEAVALRDQALAALFYRTGWTQERLAKVEGKSREWATKRLVFGRFLAFASSGTSGTESQIVPRNLSERRFRGYWERTDKSEANERIRFRAVASAIEKDVRIGKSQARKPEISGPIRDQFSDGKWHKLQTIIEHIDATPDDVEAVLADVCNGRRKGLFGDRKKIGPSFSYRIRKIGRTIPYEALMQDLGPIIDGLKAEGRKNAATASPDTVAHLAHQLEQLLEKLAK